MFKQRASFDKSYDEGRFGRFAPYPRPTWRYDCRSASGRCNSTITFPKTPQFLSEAFLSGGWISGICYPRWLFVTALTGFRNVSTPLPWQADLSRDLLGLSRHGRRELIIDSDHWRISG